MARAPINDKVSKTNPLVSQFTASKKITDMLFAGLGSVRIVKNCDIGLEVAALGAAALGSIFKTSVTVFHYTDLPASQ